MDVAAVISEFMETVKEDPRISPVHISLYMAIVARWAAEGGGSAVCFTARGLMPAAKIGGRSLFCKTIRELHAYGYVRYEPSFKPDDPSKVFIHSKIVQL